MHKWVYDGPVMIFGKCVIDRWKGETMASTMSKALNNLSYQFKKRMNLIPSTKVTLVPGKVKREGENNE